MARMNGRHGKEAIQSARPQARRPMLLALEPRIMFDGAAVATAADTHSSSPSDAAAHAADASHAAPVEVRAADPSQNNGKKEVAFIDTSVADWVKLVQGIGAGIEVQLLEGGQSGLEQMAQWAETHSGYDAIHILSHGADGQVILGSDRLNAASLSGDAVQADLAALGRSLTNDGDLMLYGCDVAAGADGRAFLDDLAAATGADVAASDDLTGAAALGGDWVLEARQGAIETSAIAVSDYNGVLTGASMIDDAGGLGGSPSRFFINVNGTLFFSGRDNTHGYELWKSDGTAEGTVMVKDINSGSGNSGPYYYSAVVNGILFFRAGDGVHGDELWKSDGTEAGTVMVKDINSGSSTSALTDFVNVNGTLFFVAHTPTNGRELWKSDGTEAGTVMVKDINSGSDASDPGSLTNVNGTLFFSANDGVHGKELWKSDGTEAGTVMVKDINSGSGSANPGYLTNVNGTVYFQATDGTHGVELWKSDGTEAGTVLVKDINSGSGDSRPKNLTNVNGTLYFQADDGVHGEELWKSDGTEAGTVLVKDINSGSGGSGPKNLTNMNGTLYFQADDDVHGAELWKSDGTEAGTVLVEDIDSGRYGSNPAELTDVNGTLFFTAEDSVHGSKLWRVLPGPTVSDGNISITSSGSGAASTYRIGDTVTVTWDNSASGDNQSGITAVTVDFSAFGGGAAVAASDNGSGIWTASYVIAAGSIEGGNKTVSVSATDANGSATTADSTNVSIDNKAPTVSSSTPADNAVRVAPAANIVLNFSETVSKGTGTIVIRKSSDDSEVETIDVTSNLVTVSGGQVTINPDTVLADTTQYYVQIAATAFVDGNGNAYAGITDTTSLSFTTADTTAPELSSSTPADNGAGIAKGADLVLTFNEDVAKGTGNIVIRKASDNSVVETIAVTSGLVTVSGAKVTINPNTTLDFYTEYYVQIDSGAIKDTSNNAYAGITDDASLSFTTGGPAVTGVTAADGNYKAGQNVDITVTFDSAVDVTTTDGTPSLALVTGGTATYLSGSGTNALVFRYTVAEGQNTSDLDYTATTALALNGGTITLAGGSVVATLTLPSPGTANSLEANQAIIIDTTAPRVTSIERQSPNGASTNADTLVYRVTFDGRVMNINAADFVVTGTTATVTGVVTAGGNAYDVTVSGGDLATLNGTVTLGFASGQDIADAAGNILNTTPTGTDHSTFTVDNNAARVTSIERQSSSGSNTNADTLVYRVTFDGPVSNLDTTDFTVTGTTATVTGVVSAGGNAYDVTVSGGDLATLNGSVVLAFAGGQNVTDLAGNPLADTTPTGTNHSTYVVDNIAPEASTVVVASRSPSTSVPISGTADANATVKIYDGDVLVGTVVANENGAWLYSATLAVGAHSITTIVTDAAGNTGPASTSVAVTVLPPPPPPSPSAPAPALTQPTPTAPPVDTGATPAVTVVRTTQSSMSFFQSLSTPATTPGGDAGGFRGVSLVSASATQGESLVAVKPIAVFDALGSRINFTLPVDTFATSRADTVVTLVATLLDGGALPGWLSFNPRTGTFVGQSPAGVSGEVVVRVVARDQNGNEALATVRIKVNGGSAAQPQGDGAGRGEAPQAPDRQGGLTPDPAIKLSVFGKGQTFTEKQTFQDQLRMANRLSGTRQAQLLAAARAVARNV